MSRVSAPDLPARLVLSLAGGTTQEFTLAKASVLLGRATTSDIVLRDWAVSRSHARIERTAQGYELLDVGSVNGTLVNGVKQTHAVLSPGDQVTLGGSSLRFEPGPAQDHGLDPTRIQRLPHADPTHTDGPLSVRVEESSMPRVAVHTASRTWEVSITRDCLTIGRDPDNDIVLDLPAVSRHHAILERRGNTFLVRDLGSSSGTWIDQERVERRSLDEGDTLRIGAVQLVFKPSISHDALTGDHEGGRPGAARRPVVLIPGFGGSNLWLGSERVWPSLRFGDIATALQKGHPLQVRGIVDDVVIVSSLIRLDQYGLLTGYLRESLGYEVGKDLLEFAYDFHQDNRVSAAKLGAAIDRWGVNAPITLIGHSMGCLVARYYIERLGGKRRVERVILIGGPHVGTPHAFACLLKGPNVLPLGMMNLRLREILAASPSWYQLLPGYQCLADERSEFDLWADDSWLGNDYRPLLRDARAFRQELGTRSSVPAVCIFGYGVPTITSAVVQRNSKGGVVKANFVVSDSGDGKVPESSAVLKHAEIHPVRQHHGSLYTDNDVKMRLKIELAGR
jgi:pSer/pThr/pTyr-binding forkhead associated (FHA) protein